MKIQGETAMSGSAEGEVATNSQAKGLELDETLERSNYTDEVNLSGNSTEREKSISFRALFAL